MKKSQKTKFVSIVNKLNNLISEMHKENPNIYIFISGDTAGLSTNFLLVDTKGGELGDDQWMDNQDEHILEEVIVSHSDCGGI